MSASPQTAGLQQLACNAPGRAIPARACVAPFPCKRRVAWSSFDSQEAWPIFHRPSLHRLNCEYTAKQPSHSNDENSPGSGAAEKETSVNHIDAPEADQEAPGSTDEHGDALLSVRFFRCQLVVWKQAYSHMRPASTVAMIHFDMRMLFLRQQSHACVALCFMRLSSHTTNPPLRAGRACRAQTRQA